MENVAESPVQPAFVRRVVAFAVDVLVEHVRIVPAQPRHFLRQTDGRMLYQTSVAAAPQLSVALDRAAHAVAGGFEHVLIEDLTDERRQVTVPINNRAGRLCDWLIGVLTSRTCPLEKSCRRSWR